MKRKWRRRMINCQKCGQVVDLKEDVKGRNFYYCGSCGTRTFFAKRLTEEEEAGMIEVVVPKASKTPDLERHVTRTVKKKQRAKTIFDFANGE